MGEPRENGEIGKGGVKRGDMEPNTRLQEEMAELMDRDEAKIVCRGERGMYRILEDDFILHD